MNKNVTMNTTTLIVDFENSDFQKFESQCRIVKYKVSSFLEKQFSSYGKMHMWIKEQCGNIPYYYNSPTSEVYTIQSKDEKKIDIILEGKSVGSSLVNEYSDLSIAHRWLKVLMASYFYSQKTYNNNKFLIIGKSFETSRGHTYQTVLEIELHHNYQIEDKYELFVHDKATRMKRIEKGSYFENKYKNEMPYIAIKSKDSEGEEHIKAFRQISLSEFEKMKEKEYIYVKNTDNKNRTSIDYHSVYDYNTSRSYYMERLLQGFEEYAKEIGIILTRKKLSLKSVQENNKEPLIDFSNMEVNLLNGLLNKDFDFSSFTERFSKLNQFKNESISKVNYLHKSINEIDKEKNGNFLFCMDYNVQDFDENDDYAPLNSEGYEDEYYKFKSKHKISMLSSQGMRINEKSFKREQEEKQDEKSRVKSRKKITPEKYLSYKGLTNKDLNRNLEVCINQLFLKDLLVESKEQKNIPHKDFLENKVFVEFWRDKDNNKYQKMFYIENGQAKVENWSDEKMQQITDRKDTILDIQAKRKKYNKYLDAKKGEFFNFKLIISNDSISEIEEIKERVLYDDKQLTENFDSRAVEYPKSQFTSWTQSTGDFSKEQIKEHNKYIEKNILDLELSYDAIRESEEHWENIKKILSIDTEVKYTNFLNNICKIKVQGKMEGKIFKTAKGIWFDKDNMQYFVGMRNGYDATKGQARSYQIRRIIELEGKFNEDSFFKLLDVEFVRYGQYTVFPYPFNLIKKEQED